MTKEAFAQRIVAMQSRMYRIARGHLRGEHDCLDAVSEAVVKAWQKRDTLREEALFETWVIRILIRECANIQRHQRRMLPAETIPEEALETPSQNEALRDALDSLPQPQRTVVVLHYMEGYSVQECAEILHTFKGTVVSRLHYARLKLRELLKEDFE